MQYITRKTLHDFCRACLQELKQRQKCNIFCLDLEMRQWLQDATLDDPSLANDTYSSNICHLCNDKLRELLEFRKMCYRSLQMVQHILGKEKNSQELLVSAEQGNEDQNQEWLRFDFTVKNVEQNNDIKFEMEKVETIIGSTYQLDTKEVPEKVEYINVLATEEESKTKQKNIECLENDINDSGSECKFNNDDDFESLDSDKESHTNAEENYSDEKQTVTKTKQSVGKNSKFKYECNQCNRKCLNQQTLNNHMRTHQGLKPFQCPKCDRSFNKPIHVREHLNEIHAEEKLNIICEYEGCGRQFQRSRSYKEHYRLKHIQQKKPVVKTEPKHVCEDCGKTYFKFARLKQHQYTHKSKEHYPFQCSDCDKAFTNQRAFSEHQLRHAGIKNFECPYCGMKKTTKNELRAHLNYHTKEKQYQCTRCPMIFNSTGNLRMHDQVVHQGLRRYTCRFCEESFGKQDSLKHHEMRHTGEKPHVCTECDKRFIQKVALKAHMKTHNKYVVK